MSSVSARCWRPETECPGVPSVAHNSRRAAESSSRRSRSLSNSSRHDFRPGSGGFARSTGAHQMSPSLGREHTTITLLDPPRQYAMSTSSSRK